MRDLRLTQPTVLILASTLDRAVDLGMRLRDAGFVAVQPRFDERAAHAIVRLRPSLVLVEIGHHELFGGGLWGIANENDVPVVMFAGKASDVGPAEARYGVRVLSIDASPQELRTTIAATRGRDEGRGSRLER